MTFTLHLLILFGTCLFPTRGKD